tara:strand:- start:254 stop:544 length:291 start_codon:yes stop_codon:yes gene_type:complete
MSNKTVLDCDTGIVSVVPRTDADIAAAQRAQTKTAEQKAQSHRDKRDNLLRKSDWTQGADVPTSIKSKWTDYRQKLRDLPAQSGFPDSVTWPTEPS